MHSQFYTFNVKALWCQMCVQQRADNSGRAALCRWWLGCHSWTSAICHWQRLLHIKWGIKCSGNWVSTLQPTTDLPVLPVNYTEAGRGHRWLWFLSNYVWAVRMPIMATVHAHATDVLHHVLDQPLTVTAAHQIMLLINKILKTSTIWSIWTKLCTADGITFVRV